MIAFKPWSEVLGKPPDWLRVVMHAETEDWVSRIGFETLDAFEISGKKWGRFPFKSYANSFYPDHDICEAAPEGEYDIVFAEQVWEHLKYPYKATQNVLGALRPGGYFLITVPFMVRHHPHPIDCRRWNAVGLKYFLEECGFDPETIRSNHWGNRDCLEANLDKWVRYDAANHSLEHDDSVPLVAWAIGQKPMA